MSKKILLLENIHPLAKQHLEEKGFDVTLESRAWTEEELLSGLKGVDAVGIRSKTKMTERVLKENAHLMAVGCFCIGTNQVDLGCAQDTGIPVFNAPYSNTRSVAELVIAEIISLSRGLFSASVKAHSGEWSKTATGRNEVRGKKLGIVGYGHIGSQVSVLAEAMGMDVYYYDVLKKLPLGNATSVQSLKDLLSISDFVTLHVPETPETKEMIGANELGHMKPASHLINASRGSVVVIDALAKKLKEGNLAGAAIDVFPKEPGNNKVQFESELCGLENVILTPHIGGSTEEAQENIGLEVSSSLASYLHAGQTYGAVLFPQVELAPPHPESHRIVHIHKNVPGVLGEINGVVSKNGLNIRAQYLATNPQVGYLVMDLEGDMQAAQIKKEIAAVKSTLKVRWV